ncbi:MAG: iron-containing alcohol dehydrogenase [Candidatus Thermoplasmatota archaeon]|nr:iron-containing alcohol dehydrogenase [Candidatus Thermoplasmatota archaeon]
MLDFDYNVPTRIHFGRHAMEKFESELQTVHGTVLLIYGGGSIKRTGLYEKIVRILDDKNIAYKELKDIQPNPRISSVRKGIALCQDYDVSFLLAVGGGSVIDCAKAIAAGYYYEGDVWDLFMGKEQAIKKALPIGTILTITATGSEMNGNAVITNEQTQDKLAIHTDLLRPRFSIIDPTLTYTVSKHQTAAGIVDIFSHILEQYFSHTTGTMVQDRLAEALLTCCIHYGPIALEYPKDYEARSNLMWTSSLALNGLLGCGKQTDWATHGIEHAVSAVYDITHAVGLAILTPVWMEYVLSDETMTQMATYAKNVWGVGSHDPNVAAREGIKKTKQYFIELGMPTRLSEVGVAYDSLKMIAKKTTLFGGLGHFKKLSEKDVLQILEQAY